MKEILTTFEAAKLLNISPYTIRLWIIKGLLKGYKTAGGHRRILAKDLIRFLKENKMPLPSFGEKKKNVLILASDSDLELKRIKKFEMGFSVVSSKTPFDLGIKIEKFKPKIILLDFDSKSFSFREIGKTAKENPEIGSIFFIGFSKKVSANLAIEAQKLGFFDILSKPLSKEELKNTLIQIFGKRKKPYRLKSSR